MKKDNFFSKTYLYPTIWALILSLIAFTGGTIWKKITGPEKVIMLNKDFENSFNTDTTITIIRFQPDEEYFKNLANLTKREFQSNYPSTISKNTNKRMTDSLALLIAKEYQLKYDSIRLSKIGNLIQIPIVNDKLVSSSSIYPENIAEIKRPKFKLPSTFKGYVKGKFGSYATYRLNSTVFKRNDLIKISIDFFNESTISKITPLIVDIVEPKTANSVYFIWGEQYDLKSKNSELRFTADFKPGIYKMTIGFYLLDEINLKYPAFYCIENNIEIK